MLFLLSIFLTTIRNVSAADEIKITPNCLADNRRLVVFTLLNLNITVSKHTSEKSIDNLSENRQLRGRFGKLIVI